jgi:tetratricopeptide (TPR) repeat protein
MQDTRAVEFDEITQPVLRAYLRAMGWQPRDYRATEVRPPPALEVDRLHLVALCRSNAKDVRAQLKIALRLDQLGADPGEIEAALPAELINRNAIACLLLARAFERVGRPDQALTHWLEAVSLDPTSGAVRKGLGLALRRQGQMEDATFHLEEAMELRTDIRLDSQLHPNVPVLVARPGAQFDIYLYQHRFYLMRRLPDSIGARPISGELYAIHKSTVFKVLRWLVRLPLLRPILLAMIRPFLPPPIAAPVDPNAPVPLAAPAPPKWRVVVGSILRSAAKRVAIWTLARPMEGADTMGAALERARILSRQID